MACLLFLVLVGLLLALIIVVVLWILVEDVIGNILFPRHRICLKGTRSLVSLVIWVVGVRVALQRACEISLTNNI